MKHGECEGIGVNDADASVRRLAKAFAACQREALRAQQREIEALREMVPHDAGCAESQDPLDGPCALCGAPDGLRCDPGCEFPEMIKCTCTRPARLKDAALAASRGGE